MSSFLDLSLLLDTLRGPTGYRLLLALLHFIWQGFAIAVVIGVALRLMRRRRAQFRYLIGLIGLAAMAVTPVVSAFWIEPPAARAPDVFVAPPEAPRELLADPEAISLEVDRIEALLLLLESSLEQAPAGLETAGVVPVELRKSVSERLQFWQPYLLFVWLLGMSLFALRLAIGARAAWWYRWGAEPLPAGAYELLLQVSKRLGVLPPRVLVSERVVEAVALGLFRPVILLPAAWMLRIPTEQLEAVLAHEIAHLRRHDLWINFAQRVLEALLFYHPAVWWLSWRVRLEREYCCDEIAAQSLNDRAAYARALEFVAAERLLASRLGKLDTALAATMGGNEMALLNRVRKVLGGEPLPSHRRWRWATGAVLVAPLALWSIVLAGELLWATTEKPPVEAPRVVDQATTAIAEPFNPFGADTAASKSSESSPFGARYANEEPVPPSAAVDEDGFGDPFGKAISASVMPPEPPPSEVGIPASVYDLPQAQSDPKDVEIERLKRENAELRVKVGAEGPREEIRVGDGTVDAEVLRELHDAYGDHLVELEKLLGSRAQDAQIRYVLAGRERIGKRVDEIIARANEETKSAAPKPVDGWIKQAVPSRGSVIAPNESRRSTEGGTGEVVTGPPLSEREITDAEMMELGKSQRALRIELEHLRKKKGSDDPLVQSLEERISSIQEIRNAYWAVGPPESPAAPMDRFSPPSGDGFGPADEKPIDPPPAPVDGKSLSVTFRDGGKLVDVSYWDHTLNAEVKIATTPDELPALLERIAPRLGRNADALPRRVDPGTGKAVSPSRTIAPPTAPPTPNPNLGTPTEPVPTNPRKTVPAPTGTAPPGEPFQLRSYYWG